MSNLNSHEPAGTNRKAVFRGTATALFCAVLGGTLVFAGDGVSNLGLTMFLLLPAATGFVTALTTRYWKSVALSLLIAMLILMSGLVVTGLEGIVCVVMASPILIVGVMLGAVVGVLAKRLIRTETTVSMAVAPILAGMSVFGAGAIEDSMMIDADVRAETVESSITIEASPEHVWNAMIQFDEVQGRKPLLMQIGLPIPESCSMIGAGVGSERVCHFNSGFIRERVPRWDSPRHLDFEVEQVQLPGRHWLGFRRATYELAALQHGHTRVTRTTTVTSTLRPACYWRLFERLGTETEHHYILESLKMKLLANSTSANSVLR
ncbi:MAG: SRPBCC family protein [Planctomycetales bacterium]|nr:SRPBCC family protein [Planctomycetales bacterium]